MRPRATQPIPATRTASRTKPKGSIGRKHPTVRFQPGDRVWLEEADGVCTGGWYEYRNYFGHMALCHSDCGPNRRLRYIKLRVERLAGPKSDLWLRTNADCMAEAAIAEGLIR